MADLVRPSSHRRFNVTIRLQVLVLVNEVGADLDQFFLQADHVIDRFFVENWLAKLIEHLDCLLGIVD